MAVEALRSDHRSGGKLSPVTPTPGVLTPTALQDRAFAVFDALIPNTSKPSLVALSGGPDSTALLVLLARWCQAHSYQPPAAMVIDHALRPESCAEAERVVKRWNGYLGCQVAHLVLDPKPGPSQDALRRARYTALTQASLAGGFGQLLTGHHSDDQLETMLERLSRGSHMAGLAGLLPERLLLPDPQAPRVLRPLLFARKAELQAFLRAEGLSYETDPSNQATHYARARWRNLAAQLDQQGIAAAAILALANACTDLTERQQRRIQAVLGQQARWRDGWLIELDASALDALEPGTRARLLSGLSQVVGWRGYPASARALGKLKAGQSLSLNRCLLLARRKRVWIMRDPRCLQDMQDGPWQATGAFDGQGLRISHHIPEGPDAWPAALKLGSLPQSVAKFAPVARNSQGDWQLATKSVLALAPQFHTVDQSYRLVTSAMQLRFSSHA